MPESERYLHNHRYTFLGWFDNPEGTGTPISADAVLTAAEMVNNTEELPNYNTTYYAVVEQDIVHANFEFRTVEQALPMGGDSGETEEDRQAAVIVGNAPTDTDGSKTGDAFNFTDPGNYVSGAPTPWERSAGYNLTIDPVDNRVYKYEFAEWWEEDLTPGDNNGKLIRKKNWNSDGEWSPTVLQQVLDRRSDKHVIAVYKRRDVASIPYTISYHFTSRTGEEKTYVKKGTLSGDDLDENIANPKITTDGDFRLTDEFILANAPYESNHGEVLSWSDSPEYITKTSIKGDEEQGTVDRIVTDVTAVQAKKNVYANFRTTPSGEYTTISIPYGANYNQSENMLSIKAAETYGGKAFSYWEVRKTVDGEVITKSYDTLFDLCMMDTYWITPVYQNPETPVGENTVTLDPSALVVGNEDWLAWTWGDGVDGTLIFPSKGLVFNGLSEKVKFVRVPKGTASLETNWSNVWNQTAELDVAYGVNNGGVFKLTGWGYEKEMYGEWASEATSLNEITLTHIGDTRNTWTDANNEVPANGSTDILYTDFEIAFEDGAEDIYTAPAGTYRTGVVLELCATLPADKSFDPTKNYGLVSNVENLSDAILKNQSSYVYDPTKPSKTRSLQISDIPQSSLTNHDRVQYGKSYRNTYKYVSEEKTYINARYLLKATAYLVKDGEVTLSNSVYVCLAAEAEKTLALQSGGNS